MGLLARVKSMLNVQWGTPGAEEWQASRAWNMGVDLPTGSNVVSEPYRQHPIIATAVSVFCEDAASVDWDLYRVDQRSGKVSDDPLSGHALIRALKQPNELMSGSQLWVASYTHAFMFGEFFWYYPEFRATEVLGPLSSERARNQGELVVLNPQAVEVEAKDGEIRYFLVGRAGQRTALDKRRLTHHRRFNPYNPLRGLSIEEALLNEIQGDYAAGEWNTRFFTEQNGTPTLVLKPGVGANYTKEQVSAYLDAWNQRHGRKRGVGVIPGGWDIADFGAAQREMDFRALRDYSREIILGAIGVPPFRAGVLDKANYANARQQDRVYWDAIKRFLTGVQQTLNYDFLPKLGIGGVEFWPDWETVNKLLEDYNEKLTAAKSLLEMGVPLTQINERLDLGLETDLIDTADDQFLGAGLKPMDLAMNPPAPPPPSSGPPADQNADESPPVRRVKSLAGRTKEQRLQYWKGIQYRTDDLERRFESMMRSHFRNIQAEVLDNLAGVKGFLWARSKAVPTDPFDKKRANKRLRDKAKPLQKESIRRGGQEVIAEIGLGISFDLESPAVNALLAQIQSKIVGINDRLEEALNSIISELVNQEGGTTIEEIRDGVREVMDVSLGRARTIARTEVGNAYSGARVEGMKQAGVERHEWLSSGDEDVRESHQIDGEERKVGEPFSNGLDFPNDPAGPADEVINCRCVTVPIVED